jgi:tagatose 1,6-diphosphate aldolase
LNVLSVGKLRGLQQCATPRGALAVLALDHRNNLRQLLNPGAAESTADEELIAFKQLVVAELAPAATAVLLDPEFGAAQCVTSGALPGRIGLLVAVEATGYTGDPTARRSRVLPGWSITKAKRMGASAIKLLVYYHPDAPTAAEIESLVRQVAADCTHADLPFFLEPLSYSLDPARKGLPPDERRRVVVETARRLTPLGVDVLKAEFPVDIKAQPDEHAWAEACVELTGASGVPWVLLSASVEYDTYLRQVAVACQAGASGVAVGRAVWQEAAGFTGEARAAFLRGIGRERMARLTSLCDAVARPYLAVSGAPPAQVGWHRRYADLA